MNDSSLPQILQRFREYLPVVVDVETGGFDHRTHALLEIAAVTLKMDDNGFLETDEYLHFNIAPEPELICDPSSLSFTGIDPTDPKRHAKTEEYALKEIIAKVRAEVKKQHCKRAILVGHNAFFDLGFVNAAMERQKIKRNPFHPFSSFDTASLSGLAYGQTVLAKACEASNIEYDKERAHSALYDARITAILFCNIVNKWQKLGGWPL